MTRCRNSAKAADFASGFNVGAEDAGVALGNPIDKSAVTTGFGCGSLRIAGAATAAGFGDEVAAGAKLLFAFGRGFCSSAASVSFETGTKRTPCDFKSCNC